ncbi:glycerol-3-phosphate phosphatase-like [Prorops nasuta]|uniref:glycerol-3-phosphate phosphatase-like n=1 Tax=Prorops nasuta TaxID=863751 RepID=UPI0034CFC6EF
MQQSINLETCSTEQFKNFLDSFDIILSDCDGVIWQLNGNIPDAVEALAKIQDLGKRVYFVSNNGTRNVSEYLFKLKRGKLQAHSDQIIIPTKVICWYLKKKNFQGEAYAIASSAFKNLITEEGIRLSNPDPIFTEDPHELIEEIQDRPSVKAILFDFDSDCNWRKLALAMMCLKREDVLYLTGCVDDRIVCESGKVYLGCGPLIDLLTTWSGREPVPCGKPSKVLQNYITEMCKVTDPARCLFIGDTTEQDMKFAEMCGYKKLFVQSGLNTLKAAQSTKETYPDYYASSLGNLLTRLSLISKV